MMAQSPTTQNNPAQRLSALMERRESKIAAKAMIAGVAARMMLFFILGVLGYVPFP
jgi:hypothetical protein